MKLSCPQLLGFLIIASVSPHSLAATVYSLAPADWTPIPGLATPRTVLSDSAGHLKISSSSTRPNDAAAYSNNGFDMTGGLIRVEWQANGGGTYCAFNTGLYHEGTNARFGRAIAPFMSTRNSWANSVVLGDGALYFTTYEFTSDTAVLMTTATGNYFDQGGTLFHQRSETITDPSIVKDVRIMGNLGDSYSSAASFIVMSATADLVPEPSSLVLLGTCALGFFVRRR